MEVWELCEIRLGGETSVSRSEKEEIDARGPDGLRTLLRPEAEEEAVMAGSGGGCSGDEMRVLLLMAPPSRLA